MLAQPLTSGPVWVLGVLGECRQQCSGQRESDYEMPVALEGVLVNSAGNGSHDPKRVNGVHEVRGSKPLGSTKAKTQLN
jgi:hypothetical protein